MRRPRPGAAPRLSRALRAPAAPWPRAAPPPPAPGLPRAPRPLRAPLPPLARPPLRAAWLPAASRPSPRHGCAAAATSPQAACFAASCHRAAAGARLWPAVPRQAGASWEPQVWWCSVEARAHGREVARQTPAASVPAPPRSRCAPPAQAGCSRAAATLEQTGCCSRPPDLRQSARSAHSAPGGASRWDRRICRGHPSPPAPRFPCTAQLQRATRHHGALDNLWSRSPRPCARLPPACREMAPICEYNDNIGLPVPAISPIRR